MPLNTIIKVHNFFVTQKIKLQIFRSNNNVHDEYIYRVEFKLHLV